MCEHELTETPNGFYSLIGVERLCCDKCNKRLLLLSEKRFIMYFILPVCILIGRNIKK
jgi:hypothetical protein